MDTVRTQRDLGGQKIGITCYLRDRHVPPPSEGETCLIWFNERYQSKLNASQKVIDDPHTLRYQSKLNGGLLINLIVFHHERVLVTRCVLRSMAANRSSPC